MIELKGKYNTAQVFHDQIESEVVAQILNLLNREEWKDSKIRIMPDVHAGSGCVIGLSMTITDKVTPNFVGVDIGCGVMVAKLKNKYVDLGKLDQYIRSHIPSGFEVHEESSPLWEEHEFEANIRAPYNKNRAACSLGSLGGGNHFIELNKDSLGNLYLVVHSGSRYLGKQIAEHYQNVAVDNLMGKPINEIRRELVERLKKEGRDKEISKELEKLRNQVKNYSKLDKDLAYVSGKDFDDYISDMRQVQKYAYLNRRLMIESICEGCHLEIEELFNTTHNYIDIEHMILRKGSVSARKGEKLIVPLNMRDGSIIAIGKGNVEWNQTSPHGAGRLMSRRKAKQMISLEAYQESMKGIYSTSVNENTIDESPFAYKDMSEIVEYTKPTFNIVSIIKPIYNFKA